MPRHLNTRACVSTRDAHAALKLHLASVACLAEVMGSMSVLQNRPAEERDAYHGSSKMLLGRPGCRNIAQNHCVSAHHNLQHTARIEA